MNGIVINIDPIAIRLGGFELRWYGIAIAVAIAAAVVVAVKGSRKHGIAPDDLYAMLPWMIVGGLVGARLFHVIDRWEYYAGAPLNILQFQQGGLAIWGALAGGILATVIYARVKRVRLDRLADTLAPALLVAQIIGRFGCIVNGDAYGGATDLPWGFVYIHPDAFIPQSLAGVPTHPYPVYEILWNGLTLLAIWRLGRVFKKDGAVFLSYIALYSLGRFLLTFVRQEKAWFLGLQEAQVVAVVIMAVSAVALLIILKRARTAPVTS